MTVVLAIRKSGVGKSKVDWIGKYRANPPGRVTIVPAVSL